MFPRLLSLATLLALVPVAGAQNQAGVAGNAATRNVGDTAGTVAAGDDPYIVNAVQRAATVADLRAVAASTASRLGRYRVAGYYSPGDTDARDYEWDAACTLPDDGGATIMLAGWKLATPGRMRLVWDRRIANVLWWGAKYGTDASFDSLPAISAAMNALKPYTPYSLPVASPSGRTVPNVAGTLYFPAADPGGAYFVSDEILFSYFVSLVGDRGFTPQITFMANAAPAGLASTKYVLRQCPLQADPSLNNEFDAQVINLSVSGNPAHGNPESGGMLLFASEGSWFDRINVNGYGVEGIDITAQRGNAGYISADGRGCQGPGVVINGEGFECAEISSGSAYATLDGKYHPVTDPGGHVRAACDLNCAHAHIGTLNVEGSPLGVRVTADNTQVALCFGNEVGQLVDAFNCDNPQFPVMRSRNSHGSKPIFTFASTSYGASRTYSLPNDGSGRASYLDQATFGQATFLGGLRGNGDTLPFSDPLFHAGAYNGSQLRIGDFQNLPGIWLGSAAAGAYAGNYTLSYLEGHYTRLSTPVGQPMEFCILDAPKAALTKEGGWNYLPVDPGTIPTPSAGATLYVSSSDGKAYFKDAAGVSHPMW